MLCVWMCNVTVVWQQLASHRRWAERFDHGGHTLHAKHTGRYLYILVEVCKFSIICMQIDFSAGIKNLAMLIKSAHSPCALVVIGTVALVVCSQAK